MKKIVLATTFMLLSTGAFAQYTGPSSTGSVSTAPIATVQQILKEGIDDQYVTVQGKIIRHIRKDHYLFADQTGEMNIELKSRRIYGLTFDDKTQVSLTGKLDKDWNEAIELEVKHIEIVK